MRPRRATLRARPTARAWVAAASMAVALGLSACTSSSGSQPEGRAAPPAALLQAPSGAQVLAGRGAPELAVQASAALWEASPVVVTVAEGDPAALESAAATAGDLVVPLLAVPAELAGGATGSAPARSSATEPPAGDAGPSAPPPSPSDGVQGAALSAELARLGATHVLHVGPGAPDLPGVQVVTSVAELPEFKAAQPAEGISALTAPKAGRGDEAAVALASLRAAGAEVVELAGVDPRVRPADVEALAGRDAAGVIGVGRGFGPQQDFVHRVGAAVSGVQLPGGGQTIFDGKRYVALYGHPLTGALGVLGEQGPKRSVARAREVAAPYEGLSGERIVPAFEIIATVASGSKGSDGDYSREWDVEVLRPLVDAAARDGVYVVLDLQSGAEDFPSQARLYEELLREPHVGLALDPEWRLAPGEKPLQQVGSVDVAEVNETLDWLAELTAAHGLPQKLVLLHQFRTDMITDREDLDLGHDELAVIVQMDGDGTLGQKLDTWRALLADAPEGLRFGWKNFYDEDEPTPSPQDTFRVAPTPWWVSYQ